MIIDAVELKRRYLQRVAGVRDDKIYIGPEIVTVELTNACNLRCQFCITDHSPGNPAHFNKAHFLSWERFPEITRDCVDLNVDQITLLGTGEPTVHPSFRDMMRHLEQQPLKVVLVTNAAFPVDHCSDVIKGDHVIINLGAVDRQQYLDLHGKDFFDRVVNNIKRLVSLRDTLKPGFIIEIDYIVNSININEKQKMQDLASELGVNFVYFRKMKVNAYNRAIVLPWGPGSDAGAEEKIAPVACLNGWFYTLIQSDGDFDTCYPTSHLSSGNIDKCSLKEFWFSSYMMELRLSGKYGHIKGIERQFRVNQLV